MRYFIITLTLALTTACTRHGEVASVEAHTAAPDPRPDVATIAPDSPQLRQIRVTPVATIEVPIGNVSAPAKVEVNANRLSHVVLPLAGRIGQVLVRIGDFVRQGQPLFSVDSPDADAAVAALRQSNAILTQSRSALVKAQADQDRTKDLLDHGAVPKKDLLNAEAITIQARASVDQASAAVEQARRKLQLYGISPDSFGQSVIIHAPVSGKVLELSVVNGEFRNDLSAPLMTIADLSSVWVSSDVPESALRLIRVGEPAHIKLAAYPGEAFEGRVALLGDALDPQTRTLKVRVELKNPNGRLKPEMYGTAELAVRTEPRPVVPASSLISSTGKMLIWREITPGQYQRVAVTTGAQIGDRIAILDGLNPQDRIVTGGNMLLTAR